VHLDAIHNTPGNISCISESHEGLPDSDYTHKGLHNHCNHKIIPWLLLVLRRIKKRQARKHLTKPRLPITTSILHKIKMVLCKEAPSHDNITFWAKCGTAFFGFLRVSEFTVPTGGSYDPSCHLSLRDVAVNNRANSCILQFFLRLTHSSKESRRTWVPLITQSTQYRLFFHT